MAIIREKGVESDFFILKNEIVNDDLSWGAMGLLCYLLSKSADWKVSAQQLINKSSKSSAPSKRDATYKIINELISKGYIKRITSNNKSGHLVTDYVVSSSPLTDLPDTVEPYTDSPDTVKPTLPSKDIKPSKDIYKKPNKKDFNISLEIIPEWMNQEVWNTWVSYRKDIGKPIKSKHTFSGQINLLKKCYESGIKPEDIIKKSITNGWQGLFEPKEHELKSSQPAADWVSEESWRDAF